MLKVSINDRALTNIISRNKKIEGRLNKGIFKNINLGDKIIFYNERNNCTVIITNINKYKCFYDMLITEKFLDVLPYCTNLNEGVELYNKIYKKKANKFDTLAFHFELI